MHIFHQSVLLKEAIDGLKIVPGEKYIDATLGGAGHTLEILKKGGQVLGIDCDIEAIEYSRKRLETACPQGVYRLVKGNFEKIGQIAKASGFDTVSGVIFDLGVSGYQLQTGQRGFSFQNQGPLDMRMDKDLTVKALDLVAALSAKELEIIFEKFGQEEKAKRIAEEIRRSRENNPIISTFQLVEIIKAVKGGKKSSGINPATKVFQALRICVNDELNNLKKALNQMSGILKKGGRLVVISFHSLEDRIVKDYLRQNQDIYWILTKKPIIPGKMEITENPRCRSAKLRIGEKII